MASVIVRQRIKIRYDGARIVLETDQRTLEDLLAAVNIAISVTPSDPDLLSVRASVHNMLGDTKAMEADLATALRSDPEHAEATLLRRHGADWGGPLYLPPWSESERSLHPVMMARWNQGDLLQAVSENLKPALAFIQLDESGRYRGKAERWRWIVVSNNTPYGPVLGHYALFDVDGEVKVTEGIVSARIEGFEEELNQIVSRFAAIRTCYLIVATTKGDTVQNLRYELPEATRNELRTASESLLGTTTTSEAIRLATAWHLEHFNMDQLSFLD